MKGPRMRSFWDERAREDAFFFVDDRLRYGDPDLDSFWAEGRTVVDRIMGLLGTGLDRADEVVEIGCGVGRLTRALAEDAARVVAIDVSEQMIELARKHNPEIENVEWIVGDGESLAPTRGRLGRRLLLPRGVPAHPGPRDHARLRPRDGARAPAGRLGGVPGLERPGHPHAAQARLGDAAGGARRALPRGRDRPEWLGSAVDMARLREVAAQAGMSVERTDGEGTQFCLVLLRREGGA